MKQLIIFALVCLPLLCACGGSQQKEADATYKTLTVTQSDQILKSDYTATLRGRQYVEIRPQVSGIITRICKSAEATLATAKLTADSKAELYKEQIVSEFDLQTARNEQAAAEAALAQAKAQEVNARNDLSYTEVKSPVNGVASMIPYRVGALVNSSITEPLVTVSDDSEVYAYFSMTENQILDFVQQYGSLKKAIENMDEVELTMSNGKTYSHVGKVDAISGTVDEGTGAVGLRAVFVNPDQFLRNGGSGKVVVPTIKKGGIIIPQAATYELQNRIFVYKVVDGKAKSTPVEVFRLNNGTEYIVETGLAPGDVIIAEGAGLVREGTVIKSDPTKE